MLDAITLPQLVEHWATNTPDRLALDPVDAEPITWLELHERSRQFARALADAGLGVNDYFLTMMPNGPTAYIGWLAPSSIGAVEVPVNHANRGSSLAHVLHNTGARLAMIHERFWPQWEPVIADSKLELLIVVGDGLLARCDDVETVALDDFVDGVEMVGTLYQAGPREVSCVIYTSGTTGPSKGVLVPWRNWDGRLRSGYIPSRYRHQDHVNYNPLGLFHLTARLPLYEAARLGSRVCTRDGFKTDAWLTDVRNHGCTGTIMVGTMGPFVHGTESRDDDADNPLEYVSIGPTFAAIDDFKRRFGLKEVFTSYSMTEIPFVFASADQYEVNEHTYRSCGRPIEGLEIRLVDKDGDDVSAGELGELHVRAEPGMSNEGYLNRPDATAAAWDGEWFRTGDVFRCDEAGLYYYVDRAKDCIRRRGENISSMEVEAELRRHPCVQECAVFGVPSEYGEEDVMAAIVLRSGDVADARAIHSFARERLPSFSVPRFIDFVESLPKTVTERVQKMVLRERGVTETTWDGQPVRRRLPSPALSTTGTPD
jgi:crotonobetaine/carnitine-CoA ligase